MIVFITAVLNGLDNPHNNELIFNPSIEARTLLSHTVQTILIIGYIFEMLNFTKTDEFKISNIFTNLSGKIWHSILLVIAIVVVNVGLSLFLVWIFTLFFKGIGIGVYTLFSSIIIYVVSLVMSYLLVIYTYKYENYPDQSFVQRFKVSLKEAAENLGGFFKVDLHYLWQGYAVLFGGVFLGVFLFNASFEIASFFVTVGTLFFVFWMIRYLPATTLAKIYYYTDVSRHQFDF